MAQTFMACTTGIAAAANKHMATLFCNGTPGKTIKIRRIWVGHSTTTTVTGVTSIFDIRRLTARTSGTATGTITKYDTANATALDATVEFTSAGTYTSGDTFMRFLINMDELSASGFSLEEYYTIPEWQLIYDSGYQESAFAPITLAANQGVSVFCATVLASTSFDISIEFTQE